MQPTTLESTGTYEQADQLRSAAPAVRVALPGDLTAWSVTRGDVIRRLLQHDHISKDPRKNWPGGFDPARIPEWLGPWIPASMFNADGEDHRRLRKLISRAFTARRIDAMRPALERIVAELLTGLEARPPGAVTELRDAFSYHIPTSVICELFGVPKEQRPVMQRVMDVAVDTGVSPEDAAVNNITMVRAVRELIEHKKHNPGDDMTSQLLEKHEGDHLTEEELTATLILMIGAGTETAVALINNSIVALLTHPEQRATITANPERWDDAIEESLRRDPPVMHLPLRYVTGPINLGEGVKLAAGDLLIVGFGAHGRDPGVHAERDEWNIDRSDKSHMAFGYGMHYCMGAALARLEAQVALPALFGRFPAMRLAVPGEELERQPSFIANDYREVPVYLRHP